jgi:predicted house-cleaning noncanonical NTP pyrophosphatase (MazG superfamily)
MEQDNINNTNNTNNTNTDNNDDNNEEDFYDAKEHHLQQSYKITKKQNNKPNNNKLNNQPNPKKFTIKDVEYIEYKKQLLGKSIPDRTDNHCEFYLCNDIEQIKYFSKNIKEYALNSNIDKDHIKSIASKIYKTKELYFVNPIALIEYVEQHADTPKDLIEIIDGHHRLKCLQTLFQNYQYDDITFAFWIQVYKCDKPDDSKSSELFRKYNTIKPFPIDINLTDIMILIIDKLNTRFNKNKFEFIKNTNQRANRPSICKKEFSEKLKSRLEEQRKTIPDENLSEVNIDNIISKFSNYNNALLVETLQWFNKKNNVSSGSATSKISENIYKKAKDNGCMLGLMPLEDLIKECVCL